MMLLLLCGFVAGGVYTWNQINRKTHSREFQACMDRAGLADAGWQMQSQIALCQDLYTTVAGGRYGPQSDMTISLASVRRPIFANRY
jgi:hypothetical protein